MKHRTSRLMGALLSTVLATALCASAWQTPRARDIAVTTNGFSNPAMGTDVQTALTWLDGNILTITDGMVDATTLNTRLSNTSTQHFGVIKYTASPTSAVVRVGQFLGFKASLTNGGIFHVTNSTAYVKMITQTNVFNPQSWCSSGTFTPLVAGYYWLGAELMSADTCRVQIVSTATNEVLRIGTTGGTNNFVSGGGLVYADGTASTSYWLEGLAVGLSSTAAMQRVVFSGHYLGGN